LASLRLRAVAIPFLFHGEQSEVIQIRGAKMFHVEQIRARDWKNGHSTIFLMWKSGRNTCASSSKASRK
jgi:hypothetical protein